MDDYFEFSEDEVKTNKTKQIIEASLFMSSDALSLEELSKIAKCSLADARIYINQLMHEYEERGSAIKIVDTVDGFKMTVKEELQEFVSKFAAAPELYKGAMLTLAFIAYKQPVKQSEVIKYRNTKAYEHINLLEQKGFIRREKQKNTYIISTTKKFFDYFGDINKQTKDETAHKFLTYNENI